MLEDVDDSDRMRAALITFYDNYLKSKQLEHAKAALTHTDLASSNTASLSIRYPSNISFSTFVLSGLGIAAVAYGYVRYRTYKMQRAMETDLEKQIKQLQVKEVELSTEITVSIKTKGGQGLKGLAYPQTTGHIRDHEHHVQRLDFNNVIARAMIEQHDREDTVSQTHCCASPFPSLTSATTP